MAAVLAIDAHRWPVVQTTTVVLAPQCQTVNQTVYETAYENQQFTAMETRYRTVLKAEQYTVMRPVAETSYVQRKYSVMKPVTQTSAGRAPLHRREAGLQRPRRWRSGIR